MQRALQIVRWISYLALLLVVTAFGALIALSLMGVCSSLNEGGVTCQTPLYTAIAEYAIAMMLLTVFTGLPALFAMLGLYFLIRDGYGRLRGGKTQTETNAAQPSLSASASPDLSGLGPRSEGREPLTPARLLLRAVMAIVALGIFAALVSGVMVPILGDI